MNTNEAIELFDALTKVNGSTIISIDTESYPQMNQTIPGSSPRIPNPHYGRVTKRQIGSSVMVFQNKRTNAYANMVRRRLIKEGHDPENFQLSPRKWGRRLPNLPIVSHNGQYYMEVIFLRPGTVEYFLDNQRIHKDDIIGLIAPNSPHQGGLSDKVIVRAFSFNSIRRIQINKKIMEFSTN